jgi:hypothetical protein
MNPRLRNALLFVGVIAVVDVVLYATHSPYFIF